MRTLVLVHRETNRSHAPSLEQLLVQFEDIVLEQVCELASHFERVEDEGRLKGADRA